MSLLGSMKVKWVTRADASSETVGGFQHKFCDHMLNGHSGQDNIQVASSLEIMIQEVSNKYPTATEIVLESDKVT